MQEVILKGPRVIDGQVRYPIEGPIPVTDDEYDRLLEAGVIDTDDDHDGEDADGLEDMTLAQLKVIADKEEVDLDGKSRKADIIAAIRAKRAPAA
ncbi:hypothetical protein [Sphingomonas nostoxanthinifaciens]|uniref:hypothetical protein n=1 Tax=Sphingomonas nostoxanthinifaciens TaxID=2872652 RepID=UPI001CC2156E|nr:hypothetical protein [Sphingomonas nostoxanthinifaciens]UAK24190.1 hypothetical protein K8P63_17965 [Sphingomonas nostoxanthinifaciens]